MQYYVENNRFPADEGITVANGAGGKDIKGAGWIETEVKPVRWLEWTQIFIPAMTLGLVINVIMKMLGIVTKILGVKS